MKTTNAGLASLEDDGYLAFDAGVTFRTGYEDALHAVVITSPPHIARRYLRSYFVLDVAAALPLELFLLVLISRVLDVAGGCTGRGEGAAGAGEGWRARTGRGQAPGLAAS